MDAAAAQHRLRAARSLVKLVKAEEALAAAQRDVEGVRRSVEAMRAARVREFGDVMCLDLQGWGGGRGRCARPLTQSELRTAYGDPELALSHIQARVDGLEAQVQALLKR
jgi:hypothetical protein